MKSAKSLFSRSISDFRSMCSLTHSPLTLGFLCKWWNSIRPSSYRQFHPSKSEGHSLYSECIWLAFKISYMEGREKFPSSKMLPDYFISKLLRCILKSDSDTWREKITSSATNQARLFTTYVDFRANDDWGS